MALRVAEVSQRSGFSASTSRYHDQIGLVPTGREPNGYRAYPEDVLDRLRFIDAARRLDLPLVEIGELVQSWESRRGNKVLKNTMFLSAFAALRDPDSRAYYDRKISQGKRHNQGLLALARRRSDVLYAMLRDGTLYQRPADQLAA